MLELASYPYEHIRAYAATWPDVEFTGTVRDATEAAGVGSGADFPPNLRRPAQLDVAVDEDWELLRGHTGEGYDGVVMRELRGPRMSSRPVNLVHCMPEGAAEDVFRNLSPLTPAGRKLLGPCGWIAAYGAYLNDDGSFRSEADKKVGSSGGGGGVCALQPAAWHGTQQRAGYPCPVSAWHVVVDHGRR